MSTLALVTGANGFVGSHLISRLLARGYRVRSLVRRSANLRWISTLPVELAYGDLADRESLRNAVEGVDIVFHTAGVIKANSLDGYLRANCVGTANIAEASASVGVKRFLHVSSLAAAGPTADGAPLTESAPCCPVSDYGLSKLRGEEEVRRLSDRLSFTIVRPPVVYGPRDEGVLEFFKLAAFGIVPSFGERRYYSIIYVDDLVRGIVAAAESPEAAGGTYFIANDLPSELGEILGAIADSLGKKSSIHLHIPIGLLSAIALFSEGVASALGSTTFINRQKAKEIAQKYWICSSAAAKRDFHFSQSVPLAEGLKTTADWYRKAGWLV